MKKFTHISRVFFSLLAGMLLAISCDDMNDIQSQYADRAEKIYLGKVDSINYYPGLGRVKLTWYVSADPKIEKTIIYWNMRNDSLVKEFTRTTPGVQKDSIMIDNLPQGSMLFEFRNVSKDGETSLYSKAAATVWGTEFAEGLYTRKLVSQNFDYESSTIALGFSPVFDSDSVVFSQLVYMNNQGESKTVRIERATNSVTLPEIADGTQIQFRTAFFLPQGIDTIFNDYQLYKTPTAVFNNGTMITLKGHLDSRYFERDGNLYEWNFLGDVMIYTLDENGSFVLSETYPSLVRRDKFREFFFHDDDKFIAIGVDNRVYMLQFIDGEMRTVKTPTGSDYLSAGYVMPTFLPSKGYFFSVYANGDLKTFFPNNNATWGSPNNVLEASGFTLKPVIAFNYKYLLGVDTNGHLCSYPISTIGKLGYKSTIGSGWDKFVKMVSVGEKLLGLDANGDFYQFDFNTTDSYWILN